MTRADLPARAGILAVTGTDTGVGKTLVAAGLLRAARRAGLGAAGYKPVASGSRQTPQGLRNDDAETLLAESAPGLSYDAVNPVTLEPPWAPHIAAARLGRPIDMATLDAALDALVARHALVVLEGAGGWHVPLSEGEDFAAWMTRRRVPTVMVVGLRLGAINHALLTAGALRHSGCWHGWIANFLPGDSTGTAEDMRATLAGRLGAPWLSVAPGDGIDQVADAVPTDRLLKGIARAL